jgi:riboflavin-specific deaminase-like protein
MRMLWPDPGADVEPAEVYAADERPLPGVRPWVLTNMIATVDGAAADPTGRSGGLGGQADKQVFAAIRAVADVIVAGSATVIAEDYGPVRLTPELREARRQRGQAEVPRLAVVTASLRIDPDRRLFRDSDGERPIVLTTASADPGRRRALSAVAEVLEVGDDLVDWARALTALRDRAGARVVLSEGGPSTNGQLVAADVVDEVCLTMAPALIGGPAPRITGGGPGSRLRPLRTARILTEDGYLFLRYVRARTAGAADGAGRS